MEAVDGPEELRGEVNLAAVPKEGSGSPVTVSMEMSRQRLFRKTRRSPVSFSQSATPRCTNPVPFGTCPHSVIRGS